MSMLLTSNRPVDDWGKLLGDTAAVDAGAHRLFGSAIASSSTTSDSPANRFLTAFSP